MNNLLHASDAKTGASNEILHEKRNQIESLRKCVCPFVQLENVILKREQSNNKL